MNFEKAYQELMQIYGEQEGIKIAVNIERRVDTNEKTRH